MVSGRVCEGRGREFSAKENLERERRPWHDAPARRHPRADPGVATGSAACLPNSMRHGIRLATDVLRASHLHSGPTIAIRTPYGRRGHDGMVASALAQYG